MLLYLRYFAVIDDMDALHAAILADTADLQTSAEDTKKSKEDKKREKKEREKAEKAAEKERDKQEKREKKERKEREKEAEKQREKEKQQQQAAEEDAVDDVLSFEQETASPVRQHSSYHARGGSLASAPSTTVNTSGVALEKKASAAPSWATGFDNSKFRAAQSGTGSQSSAHAKTASTSSPAFSRQDSTQHSNNNNNNNNTNTFQRAPSNPSHRDNNVDTFSFDNNKPDRYTDRAAAPPTDIYDADEAALLDQLMEEVEL